MRKIKRGKREEELHELMTLEEYTETDKLENDGGKGHDLRLFTYSSILAATNSFSSESKLGEGGFGPVYKGKMIVRARNSSKCTLTKVNQGLLEFKIELILTSKIQHTILVKLLGFRIRWRRESVIVYDYMPNKSLDFFLFHPGKEELLHWDKRSNVIDGIAQGLLYLHKYSLPQTILRDLKASNILLDENMEPEISDFGLAKIFKQR